LGCHIVGGAIGSVGSGIASVGSSAWDRGGDLAGDAYDGMSSVGRGAWDAAGEVGGVVKKAAKGTKKVAGVVIRGTGHAIAKTGEVAWDVATTPVYSHSSIHHHSGDAWGHHGGIGIHHHHTTLAGAVIETAAEIALE
jgi:hypothetical protein